MKVVEVVRYVHARWVRSSRDTVTSSASESVTELADPVERVVFCIGVIPAGDRDVGADGEVFTSIHGLKGQRLLCSDEVALPQG